MRNQIDLFKIKLVVAASVGLFATSNATHAAVLLVVDLTTPNQITISATAGNSDISTTGSPTTGVYLEDFFSTGSTGFGGILNGGPGETLTSNENPADGTPSLWRATNTEPGLNIWSWSSDIDVSFTAGSLAFVGTATWPLLAGEYSAMLAGGDRGGDLYFPADSEGDVAGAALLGQYTVIAVPEPSSVLLGTLALATMTLRRRR